MSSAIERLAVELRKLSAHEWTRLDERRMAGQDPEAASGQAAYADIAERLRQGNLAALAAKAGDSRFKS